MGTVRVRTWSAGLRFGGASGAAAVVLVVVAVLTGGADAGTVLYVDDDATGGSGLSWASAHRYLQDALTHARSDASVTEIWIAEGTYYPNEGTGVSPGRDATFEAVAGVTLYGGFPNGGGDGTFAARDLAVHETILSGDIDHDGITDADNSYNVVLVDGTAGEGAVLDGLIVERGYADGAVATRFEIGAGVCVWHSAAEIRRCTFRYGWAISGAGVAVRVIDVDRPGTTVLSSVFLGGVGQNSAGGIYWDQESEPTSPMRIAGCTFVHNDSLWNRGAGLGDAAYIYNGATTEFEFRDSIVYGNDMDDYPVRAYPNGAIGISHSCFWPADVGEGDIDPLNNLHADPLLVDAPDGDFHLSPASPCIDWGTRSTPGIDTDRDGRPRLQASAIVPDGFGPLDIGAFESDGLVLPGGCAIPQEIYVSSLGEPQGCGDSWAGACSTLEGALWLARQAVVPVTVRVAEGFYPVAPCGCTSWLFEVAGSVEIRAGYPAVGGVDRERNWGLHPAIVTGDVLGDDAPGFVNRGDNVALFAVLSGGALTLDGLIVEGGERVDGGGAVLGESNGTIVVRHAILRDNAGSDAGAIVAGPGTSLTLENTLIAGNLQRDPSGSAAGAVLLSATNGDALLRGCTIVDNLRTSLDPGGAIVAIDASVLLRNGIVWDNDGAALVEAGAATIDAAYAIVQGGWSGGDHVLDVSPQFVNRSLGDYRLYAGSPAVDAGSNLLVPIDDLLDVAGLERFSDVVRTPDTGQPDGIRPIIDMGAFESTGDIEFLGDSIWTNVSGGSFLALLNWYPGIPAEGNRAVFDLPAAYGVTLTTSVANDRVLVSDGDVALLLGGHAYDLLSDELIGIVVADQPGEQATLRLQGGFVNAETAALGREVGAEGTLVVDAASLVLQDDIVVGDEGVGHLEIANGGELVSVIGFVGRGPTAHGSVLVDGLGSRWSLPLLVSVENGTVTLANGGEIEAGFGIAVTPDGRVEGDGTLSGLTVNFGRFEPGGANGIGTLTVDGTYEQLGTFPGLGDAAGSLRLELEGSGGALAHDALVVNGTAELGGGLIVSAPVGFDPADASSLPIVSAGTLQGSFDVALLPALVAGEGGPRFMNVRYGPPGFGPGNGTVTLSVEDLATLVGFDPLNPDVSLAGAATALAVGELDGLSGDDIALTVADSGGGSGTLYVLLNDGTGQSFTVSTYAVGVDPIDLAIGQFDGAGLRDVVVANAGSDSISVVLSPGGSGTIVPEQPVGATPQGIGAFAVDGQSHDEVVVTAVDDGGIVRLFDNDGSGNLVVMLSLPGGELPKSIDPIDIDNDKDTDLVLIDALTSAVLIYENHGGVFNASELIEIPAGEGTIDLSVRDVNNDALADVVTSNLGEAIGAGTVTVILNDAVSQGFGFAPPVTLPVTDFPRQVTIGDFDGDQDQDVALLGGASTSVVQILRNDLFPGGSLIFAPDQDPPSEASAVLLGSGALDGSVGDDLVTINDPGSGLSLGGVVPAVSILKATPESGTNICPWDLDGNDAVDFSDLLQVLSSWGPCTGCRQDIDDTGDVGFTDLLLVLSHWGPCGM